MISTSESSWASITTSKQTNLTLPAGQGKRISRAEFGLLGSTSGTKSPISCLIIGEPHRLFWRQKIQGFSVHKHAYHSQPSSLRLSLNGKCVWIMWWCVFHFNRHRVLKATKTSTDKRETLLKACTATSTDLNELGHHCDQHQVVQLQTDKVLKKNASDFDRNRRKHRRCPLRHTGCNPHIKPEIQKSKLTTRGSGSRPGIKDAATFGSRSHLQGGGPTKLDISAIEVSITTTFLWRTSWIGALLDITTQWQRIKHLLPRYFVLWRVDPYSIVENHNRLIPTQMQRIFKLNRKHPCLTLHRSSYVDFLTTLKMLSCQHLEGPPPRKVCDVRGSLLRAWNKKEIAMTLNSISG